MEQNKSGKLEFIFKTESGKEIKFRVPAPEAELKSEEALHLGRLICRAFRARNGEKLTEMKSAAFITCEETTIIDRVHA